MHTFLQFLFTFYLFAHLLLIKRIITFDQIYMKYFNNCYYYSYRFSTKDDFFKDKTEKPQTSISRRVRNHILSNTWKVILDDVLISSSHLKDLILEETSHVFVLFGIYALISSTFYTVSDEKVAILMIPIFSTKRVVAFSVIMLFILLFLLQY